eukprot:TRINITY_DN369_c1_g3_i1.p1 TRINITY_DN369_c1_g3~~TRINITY_DN369_c1_g3_i1.p1  ORF type:complete len:450 (-),score=65.87 TRINITY_DN369_c1_g3_i1:126-1475(-)
MSTPSPSQPKLPYAKRQELKRKTKEALWEKDSSASACGICGTTFSLLTRRHHCRSCGRLFCGTCCSTKKALPQYGYDTPVRICDICAKDVTISQRELVKYENAPLAHSELIQEWVTLCRLGETELLKEKMIGGIPDSVRSVVWSSLADAASMIEKNPGVYEMFKGQVNAESEIPILLDIPRTYPDHPRFGISGTDTALLSNVLIAYASFDKEVGYTQGMSFIVAVLLMHMNEETSFWTFVQMLRKYKLEPFFQDDVYPELLKDFSRDFKYLLPDLDAHLKSQGCVVSIFAVQWIRTLFALDFELSVAFRLWDIFFVEGLAFVSQFIMTMFRLKKKAICELEGGQMLIYIKTLPKQFNGSWSHVIRIALREMKEAATNPRQRRRPSGRNRKQSSRAIASSTVIQSGFSKKPTQPVVLANGPPSSVEKTSGVGVGAARSGVATVGNGRKVE